MAGPYTAFTYGSPTLSGSMLTGISFIGFTISGGSPVSGVSNYGFTS